MKLVRYGRRGRERPGLIDADGVLRDLAAHVPDIGPATLAPKALAALRRLDAGALPAVPGRPRLGVPVAGVGKIVAAGLNYRAHAAAGHTLPDEPILFLKAPSALCGARDAVRLPPGATRGDWEVELALVIGRHARAVPAARALDHVAGYCIANDVSERGFQFDRGPTWDKGKSCDTFCPLGPWLVTRDEVPDPQALDLRLSVDGELMQASNTADMLFTCAELVACASRYVTLHPGDVLLTGTPPGSGFLQSPPHYLRPGQTMQLSIAGLGMQRSRVARQA
ncbi:2-keto-4-pentenoate hydratase/2-oxohepta-3-ene-1,7-dioic acid hydratase (catechol pathway) [Aromatoleum tolulyticum]|uniref:2-keto-4-pentenoate hydratase/2-oxohepta-3-ene-1,7-dioic acid hydratase (Catechol pathway) n=1 Tax=Aromatoleum tolulyticum TaxID=34027 RepID=A0A1N6NFK9_9RHOO|nr:fumarylacetoacetate hydrolase family protein [Aromatoleum tolulyticum]SIP90880.1 2-keto-4-pentenoate hydratase/2-oxohepta-3-ene-1,7-dioic acid hydratase (catechol pathway) [Aromatoleum tolulyticum]